MCKTEKIFEIKNSALSEDTKAFILQSLKSLSLQNLSDCQEIGHDLETETDEKAENQAQIKNLMEKENLTENQAFLVVNGFRSLAEAKKASARVQTRKQLIIKILGVIRNGKENFYCWRGFNR